MEQVSFFRHVILVRNGAGFVSFGGDLKARKKHRGTVVAAQGGYFHIPFGEEIPDFLVEDMANDRAEYERSRYNGYTPMHP